MLSEAGRRLGLAPRFLEYLDLQHPNNNVHNLRLCRLLVTHGRQSGATLLAEGVTAKVRRAGERAGGRAGACIVPFRALGLIARDLGLNACVLPHCFL